MPYGTKRKSYFADPPAKRRRTMPVYRRRAKTQYTKRVPVKAKTATRINKSRISKLESKINGHVQKGYHLCPIRNIPNVQNAFCWAPFKPILFPMNDFYTATTATGCGKVYFPIYSGASPNITMQAANLTTWIDYRPGQSQGFSTEYDQWKDVILSQPSKVGYQPLYATYRITVNRRKCTPAQGDMWVRVDVFKVKRLFLPTVGGSDPKRFVLPESVGALSHMASETGIRNSFNPALWSHVKKTRWIKLRAVEVDMENVKTNFYIKMAFPKKFLKINMDIDSAGAGEPFYQAVDPKNIYWCLLSLSNDSVDQSTNPTPDVTMSRHVSYRDSRGSQM